MYSEIGQFSLLIVAISSLFSLCYVPNQWLLKKKVPLGTLLSLVHVGLFFSLISIVALAVAFVTDDFSLVYVASHSNTQLPVFFKGAAVWGGHEGSLLFWVVTLALWNSAIALNYKKLPDEYLAKALLVSSTLVCVFAFFTLLASNPFEVNSVFPEEGRDLNPMLQDVALIFHPPLLYIGYIGFASSFALALAALWQKDIPSYWLAISRRFSLIAWTFLTSGVLLGAWWAYYELGWGGWWFWDPVENASLLPWLTGTALVHSLIISQHEKRLMKWSYGLSFITFSLSILGTFVVRSGIITSVHAFAVDPTRGVVLIAILITLVLVGFGSQIFRSDDIKSKSIPGYKSRSFLFLLSNGLFTIAMITVLLGTFYPMIFQIFGLGKISVGAPYFNTLFAPLTFIALLLMSAAIIVKNNRKTGKLLVIFSIVALLIGTVLYRVQYQTMQPMVLATWVLCSFVCISMLHRFYNVGTARSRIAMLPMCFAHGGIVLACIGASMNAYHSVETSAKLGIGDRVSFERFQLTFESQNLFIGPNYTAEQVLLRIDGKQEVVPERRHYQVRVMNMTEPGIKSYWHGDLYITLGEKLYDGSFAVRIQYKAYIQWIWFGGLLMVFGGVASLVLNRRTASVTMKEKSDETS
ncbi:heme lyase CcmF/NrfE family subunit [Vibrio sp. VB16]|uniref:heme lyase CcmF/NrfE family subunit n=1 Tax=Vibrio sp. VB16 TaxID=2785746 RepID=UPI0018A0586E|nr:heme lyase CcmF/NrfE family subunit [Vibrio sp. VB16]UGA56082.1 heme lyase CcmF/NrfE family subunit [Vibrio sp. VB16]